MPPVLHDGTGQVDRVPDVPDGADRARPQRGALHHPGVELGVPVEVHRRAHTGIEDRLVLHVADRREHDLQGAEGERRPAGVQRPVDRGLALGVLALGRGAATAPWHAGRPAHPIGLQLPAAQLSTAQLFLCRLGRYYDAA